MKLSMDRYSTLIEVIRTRYVSPILFFDSNCFLYYPIGDSQQDIGIINAKSYYTHRRSESRVTLFIG